MQFACVLLISRVAYAYALLMSPVVTWLQIKMPAHKSHKNGTRSGVIAKRRLAGEFLSIIAAGETNCFDRSFQPQISLRVYPRVMFRK
jgi:hypothetical protein